MQKLLKAAAGLGKTSEMLKALVEQKIVADIYAPSVRLCQQIAKMVIKLGGQATMIYGRTYELNEGERMCEKWDLVERLYEKGIKSVQAHVCIIFDDKRQVVGQCEYYGKCRYAKQFQENAAIRIYTHAYLPLPHNIFEQNDTRMPTIAVVDEDPLLSLVDRSKYDIGKLIAQGGLTRDITQLILGGGSIVEVLQVRYDNPTDRLKDEMSRQPLSALSIMPGDSCDFAIEQVIKFKGRPFPYSLYKQLIKALKSGEEICNNVWVDGCDEEPTVVYVSKLRLPKRLNTMERFVIMDATPNVEAWQSLYPDIEVTEIEVERNARVIQVYDSPVSKARLERSPAIGQEIAYTVQGGCAVEKSVALCASKAFLEEQKKIVTNAVTANFGGLRGLNTMEDCKVGFIVGRNQPRPFDVELIARATWPYEHMHLTGEFIQRPSGYRMRDGRKLGVLVRDHPDPWCRSVLRQIRESETTQAIDRQRLVHNKEQKDIYLLSNVPTDVTVDEVVELREIIGYPKLARLVSQAEGALPMNADWLVKAFHEEWPSTVAARNWNVRSKRFIGNDTYTKCQNLNYYIYRKRHLHKVSKPIKDFRLFALRSYRLHGDRCRPRKAICWNLPDKELIALLSRHHGQKLASFEPMPEHEPIPDVFKIYQDRDNQWHEERPEHLKAIGGHTEAGRVFYLAMRIMVGSQQHIDDFSHG